MRIWIDVEDLFQYSAANRRPSGIQRLAFELYVALRACAGPEGIGFVRHDPLRNGLAIVPWEALEADFRRMTEAGPGEPAARGTVSPSRSPLRATVKRLAYRLPEAIRRPAISAARSQAEALRAQFRALRYGVSAIAALVGAIAGGAAERIRGGAAPAASRPLVSFEAEVRPGDVIAVLGSPWFHPDYAGLLRAAKHRHGVRVLMLIYDIVPIRRPEWCDIHLVRTFTDWMDSCLPEADVPLAISRASAEDTMRYAEARGLPLAQPIRPIPIGSGFGAPPDADPGRRPPGLPEPGSYVLFLSTIEARKNHTLMFRVWRRLLEDLPADKVPQLVFAGRVGWLVQDLMQQLENAGWLDGHIRLVEAPSDEDVVHLYRGCLFTVFPSLYEGWGLPVTESLAFGKPCVISNTSSLPEAGGALARYFDPDDLNDVVAVIRDTVTDREGLAAWEERVRREFVPVPWEASARAILEALA